MKYIPLLALFIFSCTDQNSNNTSQNSNNRYEHEFRGIYVYRFDKQLGIMSRAKIPKDGDYYYSWEEAGNKLTVSFTVDYGSINAFNEHKQYIEKFKVGKKNFKLTKAKFENIVE